MKRTDSTRARLMRAEVSGIRVTELPSTPLGGLRLLPCGRQAVELSSALSACQSRVELP